MKSIVGWSFLDPYFGLSPRCHLFNLGQSLVCRFPGKQIGEAFFFVRLCGSRQGFHLSFRYCFLITVSLLGVFLTPHSFFHAYTTPNAYFLPLPVPLLLSWLFSCLTSRFFLWCSDWFGCFLLLKLGLLLGHVVCGPFIACPSRLT